VLVLVLARGGVLLPVLLLLVLLLGRVECCCRGGSSGLVSGSRGLLTGVLSVWSQRSAGVDEVEIRHLCLQVLTKHPQVWLGYGGAVGTQPLSQQLAAMAALKQCPDPQCCGLPLSFGSVTTLALSDAELDVLSRLPKLQNLTVRCAVEVCHAMQCCAPGSGGLPCYAVLRTRQWRSAMLCSAAHQAVHRSASAALDVPFCRRLCCCVGAVVLQLHQQQPYDMHLHVMPGKSMLFSTVELSLALKSHTCAVLGLTGRRRRRRPPGVPHGAAAGEAAVADTGRRGAGQATGGGAGLGLVLGWCWCCTLCMCCS
jgi:hypothetical protein